MNTNGFRLPVYIAKGAYTAGHVGDIGALQVGIIDKKTNSVATATGNGTEFYLAGGSPHTKDKLSKYVSGMLDPKKSYFFRGQDIQSFEKSIPTRPQSESWVIGYDGSKGSQTLQFQRDTTYKLKIRLYGEPIYRFWNKSLEKVIPLYTGCAVNDDCSSDCNVQYLGAKTQTRAWVKAINDNIELQELGLKAFPIFSDYSATATTGAFTGGTGTAATTSIQVTNGVITGVTVLTPGAYSVAPTGYTLSNTNGGAGATFTIQTSGSSPSIAVTGVTVTSGGTGYSNAGVISLYKYTIKVVDNGDESALQTVQRLYPITYGITRVLSLRGVSTYTTVPIAASPAAFQPKTFYYVADCNTCLGSDTLIGGSDTFAVRRQLSSATDLSTPTARTNYAAQVVTDYSGTSGTGVYLGEIAGEAVVEFKKVSGATPANLNSDVIEKIASIPALCQPATPATIAWVQGEGSYVTSRTLTLTVSNEDCKDVTTVAKIQGLLAGVKSVDPNAITDITDVTGTGIDRDFCVTVFQVVQTSFPMHDQYCMSPDNTGFEDLPNYKSSIWKEVAATPEAYNANIHTGIRLTSPMISQRFGLCSYDVDEYYDLQPVQMEVSIYIDEEQLNPCTFSQIAQPRRAIAPRFSKLSGDWVLQDYIKQNSAYFIFEQWAKEPRMREVIDNTALSQIKRDSYYVAYYFHYRELRNKHNFHQSAEHWESIIYIDEADRDTQVAFENAMQAVTAKYGVYLKNR